MNAIEIKFYCTNWWSNPIYKTKNGTPIVKLDDGFYTITDVNDIDSDPYKRIKDGAIVVVEEFTK